VGCVAISASLSHVEEGLGEPGEGIDAGGDDAEGGGARQGKVGGRDDGDGLMKHDDLSSGTELAPVEDRV